VKISTVAKGLETSVGSARRTNSHDETIHDLEAIERLIAGQIMRHGNPYVRKTRGRLTNRATAVDVQNSRMHSHNSGGRLGQASMVWLFFRASSGAEAVGSPIGSDSLANRTMFNWEP
jgi:hypothetical protein